MIWFVHVNLLLFRRFSLYQVHHLQSVNSVLETKHHMFSHHKIHQHDIPFNLNVSYLHHYHHYVFLIQNLLRTELSSNVLMASFF